MKTIQRWVLVLGVALAWQVRAADPDSGQPLSGKAVDAQGNPVAGAEVDCYQFPSEMWNQALGKETKAQTTTDSQGAFTFPSTGSASIVVVKKTGLATAWKSEVLGQQRSSSDSLVLGAPSALAGVVVDENGEPVEGAEVWVTAATDTAETTVGMQPNLLIGKAARESFSARTTANGRFHIENFPANASADLGVIKKGKTLRGGGNDLAEGLNGSLSYHAGKEDARLVVEPAASIEGKVVVEETGQGLAGVRLRLQTQTQGVNSDELGGAEPVQSGADGSFRITDVAAGSYRVKAEFEGKPVADWIGESDPVTLGAGETLHDVQVRASKGGLVVAAVISKTDQKPVPDMNVIAYSQSGQTQTSASTGASGVATLRLAPGQWILIANKPGWSGEQNTVTVENGQTNRAELDVTPPLSIQGTVRGPTGDPVAGAHVSVGPNFGGNEGESTTDASGHYKLTWAMQNSGNASYSIIARSQEMKLAVTHDIDETITNLDLQLQPALTLSAKVEDANGKPITNAAATVMLFSGNMGFQMNARDAKADDQGRIRIEALPQGQQYSMNVSAKGFGSASQPVAATDTQSTNYELPTFVLALADLKLAGKVIGANNKPAVGVMVQLNGEGQPNGSTRTDSTGHFSFDAVCAGPINLYVNAAGSFGNAQTVGGDTNVSVRLQSQNNVVVNTQPSLKITGIVTDPSGAPVAGARLVVYPNYWGNSEARTGANGRYSMTVQNSEILFQQAGNMNSTPTIVARSVDRDLATTHEISERTTNLDLRLEEGLTITAKVQDADGKPLRNASAALMYFSGLNSFQMNGEPARADDEGRIRIQAVPQGQQYSVNITASGYGSASQTLSPGDTKTTTFDCRPFVLRLADHKLAGRVLGVDGKPVIGAQVQISGEGQPNANTRTDAKGHFAFAAVCEGPVQLFAYDQGGGNYLNANVQARGGDTNVTVRFTANNNNGGGGTPVETAGTVFGPAGAPAAGVSLSVMTQSGGNNADIRSDSDGKYSIDWQFQQINNGGGNNFKNLLIGRDEEHNLAAVQEVDDKTTSADLHLQPGLKLTGSVADPNGAPLTSAQIQIYLRSGNNYSSPGRQQMGVDAHGSFSISALPQGREYLLMVTCPGHGTIQKNLRTGETQTESMDLPVFTLKVADRELEGQVVGADDQPVSGAQVQINGDGQPNANTRSDSDGHFSFKQVCEGPVQLFAYRQGGNGQFLQGNVQAQGGDTNVVVKIDVNGGRRNTQAAPRFTPLKPPPWEWASISQWPKQHRKLMIVLLGVQLAALTGTAGGILWVTRKRGV